MTDDPLPKSRRRRLPQNTIKLASLIVLALATLIPASMISDLIDDRQVHEQEAKTAVAQSWGPPQTLIGPTILMSTQSVTEGAGHATGGRMATTYVRVAPKTMDAEIEIAPERRHRGFFDVNVFRATVHLKGTFAMPEAMRVADGTAMTLPKDGLLTVRLDSLAGVTNADQASAGSKPVPWQVLEETGSNCGDRGKVLAVPASFGATRSALPFEATLHLRGTGSAALAVMAKEMHATIKGAWGSPSFIGDEPPLRSTITRDGFEATWQTDSIGEPRLVTSTCVTEPLGAVARIGIDLLDPVSIYHMVTRAAKYAPLFIVLAFATYFLFELLTGVTISLIQYGLMAASLSLFALLLVSFGEFAGYAPAYAISAALVVAQASIFTGSVTRRSRVALGFAALLSGLFGFLYVLLGLETFALLAGSIALFVVLSIVMAAIQKIFNRGVVAA